VETTLLAAQGIAAVVVAVLVVLVEIMMETMVVLAALEQTPIHQL
jgi:hypothetical protein